MARLLEKHIIKSTDFDSEKKEGEKNDKLSDKYNFYLRLITNKLIHQLIQLWIYLDSIPMPLVLSTQRNQKL